MRILFCGQSGYPARTTATMNRYVALAEAMAGDNEAIFVNTFASESLGTEEGNRFRVLNVFNHQRPVGFFRRNILKAVAPLIEFIALVRLSKDERIDWVNVYTQYFFVGVYYSLLAQYFGYKTILHCVERRSEFANRAGLMRINDWLFEHLSPFMFDRYIAISHNINGRLKAANARIRTLVVPPICDFAAFESVHPSHVDCIPYLLFCGSSAYGEVIEFTVESFQRAGISDVCDLVLVISGNLGESARRVIDLAGPNVRVMSGLEYHELISLYKGAVGLLAPLRPTAQDEARFPQKICEYISSRGLLITTNVGEVKYYFSDLANALVASEYSVQAYSDKLAWALSSPDERDRIRNRSYSEGLSRFDISAYKLPITEFLTC